MPEIVTPQAQRLRRPSWRDSRLLLGLALVLASTALGGWVVARADRTVPMYAAERPIVPGQALTAGDVRRVDVRLGDGAAAYLSASGPLPGDAHALRPLAPGELIPLGAVGGRETVRSQVLAVQADATGASMLTKGSIVDVYVNRPTGSAAGKATFAGPERRLQAATVAGLAENASVLGGAGGQRTVQLVVPVDAVQGLVADIDLGAKITLVPAPGSLRAGSS